MRRTTILCICIGIAALVCSLCPLLLPSNKEIARGYAKKRFIFNGYGSGYFGGPPPVGSNFWVEVYETDSNGNKRGSEKEIRFSMVSKSKMSDYAPYFNFEGPWIPHPIRFKFVDRPEENLFVGDYLVPVP